MTFALFATNSGGNTVAGPMTNSVTGVTNGLLAVMLDFGNSVFTGSNLWLEIGVRTNGAASFTTLSPRQPILPMPYAIMANSASNLLGTLPLAQLGAGTASISISGSAVTAANGVVTTGNYADPGWITSLAGSKISGNISGNAITATTASNVVSGIAITNAFITNSVFAGNGFGLTNLNATNLVGTIPDARLSTNVALLNGTNVFTGTNTFAGVLIATNWNNLIYGTFAGNGGGLTNIYATNLVGTIPDARLSTNVAMLNGTNLFTGTNTFAGVTVLTNWNNLIYGTFTGNGGGLTNIYATNLVGTIPDARLSTNVAMLNGTNLFTGTNTFAGVTVLTNWNNLIYGTFAGNGGGLTNIYATNLVGTIPDARLSTNVALLNGTNMFTGTNTFAGVTVLTNWNNLIYGTFAGNGGGLTNLNATNLVGTIPDARLSTNVATLNGTNLFTGTNTFAGVTVLTNWNNVYNGAFAGNGGGLTNLPGSNPNTAFLSSNQMFIASNTFNGVVTATNVNNQISGTFRGNGFGLTNLNTTNLVGTISNSALPANISISGTNVIAPLTVAPRVPVSALGSAGTATSPDAVVVAGRYAYVVNRADNTLKVVDVSNSNGPTGGPVIVGSATTGTGSGPNYIAVAGRFAYVVNMIGNTLQIFDVNNPANPVLAGSAGTGNGPSCVAVAGRYAYVVVNGSPNATLQIFDVGDPTNPMMMGSAPTGPGPISVAVSGRYAYVVNQGAIGLQAFDVSSAGSPVIVGAAPTGSGPISVAMAGRYAYVVTQPASLQVFDVSNPGLMSLVGFVGTGNSPMSVAVSGRFACVVNGAGNTLQTFDLGGPMSSSWKPGLSKPVLCKRATRSRWAITWMCAGA